MISAPCSRAFSATADLYVSTDTGTLSFPRSRFNTGIKRRSSSASEMRDDPGRVDSAPMSMMSAPCSSSLDGAGEGAIGILVFPAVRERIRSDVDHAHDQRSFAAQQFALAQFPDVGASSHEPWIRFHFLPTRIVSPGFGSKLVLVSVHRLSRPRRT